MIIAQITECADVSTKNVLTWLLYYSKRNYCKVTQLAFLSSKWMRTLMPSDNLQLNEQQIKPKWPHRDVRVLRAKRWEKKTGEKETIHWEIEHCSMFKHNRTAVALHFSFHYFLNLFLNNIVLYSVMTIRIN